MFSFSLAKIDNPHFLVFESVPVVDEQNGKLDGVFILLDPIIHRFLSFEVFGLPHSMILEGIVLTPSKGTIVYEQMEEVYASATGLLD